MAREAMLGDGVVLSNVRTEYHGIGSGGRDAEADVILRPTETAGLCHCHLRPEPQEALDGPSGSQVLCWGVAGLDGFTRCLGKV